MSSKTFNNNKIAPKNYRVSDIEKMPIYQEFLAKIPGLAPSICQELISVIRQIDRFDTVSKLWAYMGYKVVDGQAQKFNNDNPINWSVRGKKICYIISDIFVHNKTPIYYEIYKSFKDTYLSRGWEEKHAELGARRKSIKSFLKNYWVAARSLDGLPLTDPFPGVN